MSHIFISYSKQDIEFVRYLRTLLAAQGYTVWMDEVRLTPGTDWWDAIETNVVNCAAFLVVMSPNSRESRWVRRELLLAETHNKPVIPVLLAGDLWPMLADVQFEDMRAGLRATLSSSLLARLRDFMPTLRSRTVTFTIEQGDITTVDADVVVLKHAQGFLGADRVVAERIYDRRIEPINEDLTDKEFRQFLKTNQDRLGTLSAMLQPKEGEYGFMPTHDALKAPHALFVGLPHLRHIGYAHLRQLGLKALACTAEAAPQTRRIAMTIHGPGFGLDETEALLSQFAEFVDAIEAGTYPPALEQITIVEYLSERAARLRSAIAPHLGSAHYAEANREGWGYTLRLPDVEGKQQPPANAITNADAQPKTRVFVALPADTDQDDFYYYGIQTPVHALGLLCETTNHEVFISDAVNFLSARLEEAACLIADLTQPDSNVYLQLGYAWGKGIPTILISRHGSVPFVGIPHVHYRQIRELEAGLSAALAEGKTAGWFLR